MSEHVHGRALDKRFQLVVQSQSYIFTIAYLLQYRDSGGRECRNIGSQVTEWRRVVAEWGCTLIWKILPLREESKERKYIKLQSSPAIHSTLGVINENIVLLF